jgi:MSHA biogenesis protein MshI
MPDRVDLSHVVRNSAKPEVVMCDSYRKEGDTLATLKRLRRELHLDRYRCTTLLKAGDYQMVQVETPNVPAGEIKTAMRWRIKDLIDYPVESATIDALTIPGEGAANRTPQAFAIAARNTVVAALVEPFNNANIPLEVIDIPELAQRNVAHCLEEKGRGFALLAFDETGGLLTFTCDGELLQHRRMEVTPADFVSADEEQRHQLFDRIVLELQRSLDNFDRQFHHVAVARVMVTPVPGADDLHAYMSANLDLPVTLLDLAQAMEFPNIPELREPGRQGQCLQLIGAAMRMETPA